MLKHEFRVPVIDKSLINNIKRYNQNFIDNQNFADIYFCLIKFIRINELSIVFYRKKHSNITSPIIFSAKSAEVLSKLLSLHCQIRNNLSTSHLLYIGMELIKAELAMITKQNYIQN